MDPNKDYYNVMLKLIFFKFFNILQIIYTLLAELINS